MGEAPAFIPNDLLGDFDQDIDMKCKGRQTAVNVGNKTYVIGGTDHESTLTVGVRISDKSTGEWVIPTVLGTRPKPTKGHSAVLLNEDRILIIKGDSADGDSFWFLEVDTPFIRDQRKKFGTEVVAWSKGVVGDAEKPIVISGPSGVGKGTLISKLVKEFPSMFGFSVSHTTRAPREKEQNGVHYHFTQRSVMEEDIRNGKFLEFASVHGNLYGTSIEAVEVVADAGKRCILDIDVQGARSVRASTLEAIFIFVCPPSFEELEKRLRARGTETEEQIQKRLRNARAELEQGTSSGLFDHLLVNDDLENCYARLKELLDLNGGGEITHGSCMSCLSAQVAWSLPFLNFTFKYMPLNSYLNGPSNAAPTLGNVPMDHSVSKIEQKILINCGKVSKSMLVLDLSSLRGGAPGRTRGLNIHSWMDGMNGVQQLS